MAETPTPQPDAAAARLDRLAARALAVLYFERAWPAAVAALVVIGVFLSLSWLGLWIELPRLARIIGVGLFAAALIGLVARAVLRPRPSRADALARLDRDSGAAHRPASALDDSLADGRDVVTNALWRLHRARLVRAAATLRLAAPSPRIVEQDRYALRAAALLAVLITGFNAGPERVSRIAAAFDWRTEGALAAGYRLDAWIDPPPYTGKPPIMLAAKPEDGAAEQTFAAPVGSIVSMRASAGSGVTGGVDAGLIAVAPEANAGESRWTLKGDAHLDLRRGGASVARFALHSIPDLPPTITLTEPPKRNARGSLTLAYRANDDYGVSSAEATFAAPRVNGKPVVGRILAEPPHVGLTLAPTPGGLGDAQTTADLADHPWAGVRADMVLVARDEGGNEGRSAPIDAQLPMRSFTKPIARALVEQRRTLIFAPDETARVAMALDALMIAPDVFETPAGVHLGLHTAQARLAQARTDAELVGVADFLWAMALRIEDGDLSEAERDMRAAQDKLRDALAKGASDEEIKQLTQALQEAMDSFVKQLAEQNQRDQDAGAPSANARAISPKELKSMLDRMAEAARSGDRASAQAMLDQLRDVLENLKSAKGRPGPSDAQRALNKSLNELDALSRGQQELRDKTFQESRRDRRPGGGPRPDGSRGENGEPPDDAASGEDQTPGEGPASSAELGGQQQGLADRLAQLQGRLKQQGMPGQEGLDDAQDAMNEAQDALKPGRGKRGQARALDAQGRALDGLQRGAQGLAKQMQSGDGEGEAQSEGDPSGEAQPGDSDPLGRQTGRGRSAVSRYDPLGAPAAQRAQRVLQELRRRLSDPARPREETDYLNRLLRPY